MSDDVNSLSLKHAWTDIRSLDNDQFISESVDLNSNGRFYAGHLISQAMFCAYQTIPRGFDINSFHSYFVKSGSDKTPMIFKVKRIRDGRNFVFRSVQLLQKDEIIFHCEFTFRKVILLKRPEKSDLKITQIRFPSVPQPERLQTVEQLREEFQRQGYGSKHESHGVVFKELLRNIEIRPCNGMEYVLGPQKPTLKQNIWVRYKTENSTEDPNFHCLAVAYLSDIGLAFTGAMPFPKTAFRVLSSMDHSGWLHEAKFDPTEYMLFEQECLMNTSGKCLIHGRLWSRNGELITSFSQEALVETIKPFTPIRKAKL
ncbi:hypothetical protein M3Y97_00442700 [Aphelenchoides bicaudatus]|nr:hypothetical protein M3Y97_00442700 [Aphelenchoides bicaudatus]